MKKLLKPALLDIIILRTACSSQDKTKSNYYTGIELINESLSNTLLRVPTKEDYYICLEGNIKLKVKHKKKYKTINKYYKSHTYLSPTKYHPGLEGVEKSATYPDVLKIKEFRMKLKNSFILNTSQIVTSGSFSKEQFLKLYNIDSIKSKHKDRFLNLMKFLNKEFIPEYDILWIQTH